MTKLLFAIKDYEYLAEKVLACGTFEKGELVVIILPMASAISEF
ncbi:hypothetical protein [Mucilaginibacter sp.]|nr:hypothetical protein [Mucilaginibacter sp.]